MGSIKYAPKYYNPNWSQYSKKRERWEKAHPKPKSTSFSTNTTSTTTSSTSQVKPVIIFH